MTYPELPANGHVQPDDILRVSSVHYPLRPNIVPANTDGSETPVEPTAYDRHIAQLEALSIGVGHANDPDETPRARTAQEADEQALRITLIGGQVLIGLREMVAYAEQADNPDSAPHKATIVKMVAKVGEACLTAGPSLEAAAKIEERRQLPANRKPGP